MKFILFVTSILCNLTLFAQQNYESDWLNVATGMNSIVRIIEIDRNDNVYHAGTIRFADPNFEGVNNVEGPYYGYISKVSEKGEFVWGFTLVNANQNIQVEVRNMKLTPDEDLIVVGKFTGAVDFDPSSNENVLIAPFREVFIASYSKHGDLNWVKQLKKNVQDTYDYFHEIRGFDLDEENNIILSGRFGGQVDFDPSDNSFLLGVPGYNSNYSGYLLKLSSQGDFIWVKSLEAGINSGNYASMAVGGNDIVTTGYIQDSIHLQSEFVDTIFKVNDPFTSYIQLILKYNSEGELLWVERVSAGLWNHLNVLPASNNNFYITGHFYGSIRFYPYNLEDMIVEHNNQSVYDYDSFIAKLNSNGRLIWCKSLATPGSAYISESRRQNDKVYLSIGGSDSLFYDGDLIYDDNGIFGSVLSINSNGEVQKELNIPNASFRYIASFNFDSNYGLIIGGNAINNPDFPIDFEPSKNELFISDIGRMAYLQRLQLSPLTQTNGLFLYPNPAQNEIKVYSGELELPAELKIYDHSGRVVYHSELTSKLTSISLEKFSNGVHTVSIDQPFGGRVNKKFVKM